MIRGLVRPPRTRVALLTLLLALLSGAAQAQPAPVWHALYLGTAGSAPVVLDLTVQGQHAMARLLDNADAVTLEGDGTAANDGTITVTLKDSRGQVNGVIRGSRSSGPNDDGRTFHGDLGLDGTARKLDLRRIAQFVDVDVREGPIHVQMGYPSFAGDTLGTLNPEIEPGARARLESFVAQGRQAQAAGELFHSWELVSSVRIEGMAGSYVSLLTRRYAYTGGAHGNHTFSARTWQVGMPGPRRLALSDLFRPGAPYLARLSPLVVADLRSQNATWVVDGQVASLTAKDLELFSLTPGGLAFTFPPYAMGPYVQGTFTVVVPYDRLLDLALPNGALDAFAKPVP